MNENTLHTASDRLLDQASGIRDDYNDTARLSSRYPAPPQPSDLVLTGIVDERKRRTDLVLDTVTKVNPDKAAEANKLSQQFGLDVPTVQKNQDEIARMARIKEAQALMQASPILARQMTDPKFAAIAQDDLDNMREIERTFTGTLGDIGVTVAKGVVGLPQAIVGLADIPTFGYAGKGVEAAGVRFDETQKILDSFYSPAQQRANKAVQQADGFFGTLGAALENPSVIGTTVVESLPQMLGGAGIARGLLQYGGKAVAAGVAGPALPGLLSRTLGSAAPVTAGAIGEGTIAAGAAAEQVRAQNKDGLLSPKQVATSIATGAGTAGFSLLGGKIAQKLGVNDLDTALASGQISRDQVEKGLARQLAEAGVTEGVLEELPQSAQEQIWMNIATDRPVFDGVGEAAAMGLLAGAATGGGFQGVQAILRRGEARSAKAEQAIKARELFFQLGELAKSSKVAQRDLDTFRSFIAQTAKGSPVQEVYIEAQALAGALVEAGVAVEQLPADLVAQFNAAIVTGGDVVVPLEVLVADVLTADYGAKVLPILRTDPDGMTIAQAQVYQETGAQELQTELDTLVRDVAAQSFENAGGLSDGEASDQPPVKSGLDVVRETLLGQLESIPEFGADARQGYAELYSRYIEATAAQMGMPIEQMFEQIGPSFGRDRDYLSRPNATLSTLPRGYFDPDTRGIFATSAVDASTFIHEAGHYFLEQHITLAMREDSSPQLKADMRAVMDWFGVESIEAFHAMSFKEREPHHEHFARSFERYLMEGKAPSPELASVFRRFSEWLRRLYESVATLKANPTDEIREVFGRMIATKEQIEQMRQERESAPMFTSAESAGMSEQDWEQYLADAADDTRQAVDDLQRRSLRDMRWLSNTRDKLVRDMSQQAKDMRASVREQVADETYNVPIYAAWRDLVRGKTDAGQPVALDMDQTLANWPGIAGDLPRGVLAKSGGTSADIVAEAYGLQSGDQLIKLLARLDAPEVVIEGETDSRMLMEHGELADAYAVKRAADEALHNEFRTKVLNREVQALDRAVGRPSILARQARQYAEGVIEQLQIGKIRPVVYTAAEARAGRQSRDAFQNGDTMTAATRKREQVVQHQLAKVAQETLRESDAILATLKRAGMSGSPGIRKDIAPDYRAQIDALLERYDLRSGTTERDIAKRKSLAEWAEAQEREFGIVPDIDPKLLDEARRTSYKELTINELRNLRDTVAIIRQLGELKNRLLTVKDGRDFDVLVGEAAATISANGGKAKPIELEGAKGVKPWLEGFMANHRKLASLVRQMDGGKDGGPMWKLLARGMNEAGTNESVMVEQATMKLAGIYAPIMALKGGTTGAKVFIPEINASLSRGGRLAVALNTGNAANRQRLMDGDGWSDAQVQAIMRTLSPVELEFVNNVWEYVDSFWPDVQAKELRVTGVAPDKVQAEPFEQVASDGTRVSMRGGYYPIKYDADRSTAAESQEAAEVAKDMLRGAYTKATTRRGHTKARAEEVKRPVRKDLGVITQHVTQVTHDLAWHEWLIDANRILTAKPVEDSIRTYYGPEVLRTLKDTVNGIAAGDLVAQTKIDEFLRTVRANITRSTMGLSFTTAMLQPFGLTQSMARIGVKPVLRGVGRWAGDAARFESSMGWITEKSDFMRLRAKTFNRELNEISGRVAGQSKLAQVRDGVLFALMQKMQMVADVPTWIGAYEKAKADNRDEATAVALADQAVLDSQGGGQTKDLAQVQRKHPFLTQFYSYFSVTLNLVAESTAATDFKNPKAAAGWLADMALLVVIPALAPALVLSALRGEDDDEDELATKLMQAQVGYMFGLLVGVRELSGLISGYPYSGPPVTRLASDLGKAGQQAADGEVDDAAVIATVRLLGTAFGIPTVQAIRSYKGWDAWANGEAPATAVLFGPPQNN